VTPSEPTRLGATLSASPVHDAITLEVRETPYKGRGVFAAGFIPAGARVLTIEGERYRSQDVPPQSFAMQVDDDIWICSNGQTLDDCVNHSCEPNTGFVMNDPVLYALRDIAVGEELSWDYSTSISYGDWSLNCLCGSKSCRGVILPFAQLSPRQQARLLPIALRYLQSRAVSLPSSPSLPATD
jgi:hypothetical protein